MKKRAGVADNPGERLRLDRSLLAAGDRVCVAVSGGADSTALLRALAAERMDLGLVLSVVHVQHGLRGAAADRDAEFVAALAEKLELPCTVVAVDTRGRATERKETIEEAARNLRYGVFREVLASGRADKIATAHTLDDQAETVLMKMLRGAWTEGLSGIHPMLRLEGTVGACVRPLLGTSRAEVVAYLLGLAQPWREDETNQHLDATRNRVRHELMPRLKEFNPRIAETLARMAANARAEEEHWQAELARWLPQLLLPGEPVRGGGRRVSLPQERRPTSQNRDAGYPAAGLEMARLRALDAGLRRRVLRAAAEECGATLDFEATERLLAMMDATRARGEGARLELPGGVRVERTARELRFLSGGVKKAAAVEYELPVPGTVEAAEFQAAFTAAFEGEAAGRDGWPAARVRAWKPGDRVEIAYSRGPKKVKEVLERMGVRGEERAAWPVVEWQGSIVWMRGVEVAQKRTGEAAGEEKTGGAGILRILEVRR